MQNCGLVDIIFNVRVDLITLHTISYYHGHPSYKYRISIIVKIVCTLYCAGVVYFIINVALTVLKS